MSAFDRITGKSLVYAGFIAISELQQSGKQFDEASCRIRNALCFRTHLSLGPNTLGQLQGNYRGGHPMSDTPDPLSPEEFASLMEVSKGEAQLEIPQLHWERLV